MDIAVNVVLLILGAAATLTAFGGDTWERGPEPLARRITARGWLSLLCLVATLALATYKEIRSQDEAKLARKASAEREAALASANANIAALSKELDAATKHLAQQTQVSLMAVLATGNLVGEGFWWFKVSRSFDRATEPIATLCLSPPLIYRPVFECTVEFNPTIGFGAATMFYYEGDQIRSDTDTRWYTPVSVLRIPHEALLEAKPQLDASRNAAVAFGELSEGHEIGSIRVRFERFFASSEASDSFLAAHPNLRIAHTLRYPQGQGYEVWYLIPTDFTAAVVAHWRSLGTSRYELDLEDEGKLKISGSVRIGAVTQSDDQLSVTFVPDGTPALKIGIHDLRFPNAGGP